MICSKCSAQLNDNDKFCTTCGQLNIVPPQPTPVNPNPVFNTSAQTVDPVFTNNTTSMAQPIQPSQPTQTMPATPTNPFATTPTNFAYPTSTPKSNKTPLIIAGVVVAFLVISAAIAIPMVLSNNNKAKETAEVAVTGVKVKVDDFTLTVPEKYNYDPTDSTITIYNNDETWAAKVTVQDGSYSKIVEGKSKIKASLSQYGYTVSDPTEKTVSGSKILTLEASSSSSKSLVGFKSASSSKIFGIEIITEDETFDYQVLEEIVKILNTAVYQKETASTNIKPSTIDFKLITPDSL